MSGRVRVRSHQKPSSGTVSWVRMEGLKPESERDSGFSDASSEHLSALDYTDVDETARGMHPGARAPQLVMGAPYSGLSPMIFMNNVLLKQPNESPPSPKPWGFRPGLEVLPQPQVVFLQPLVSSDPSLQRRAPVKRRYSKKYLPILKSYAKIAPHPGDSPADHGGSRSTERGSSASRQRGRRHGQKRQSCPAGVALPTPPTLPAAPSQRALSPKQCPPSLPAASSPGAPSRNQSPSTLPAAPSQRAPSPNQCPPTLPAASSPGAPSPNRCPPTLPAAPSPGAPSPKQCPPTLPAASSPRAPSPKQCPPTLPAASSPRAPSPKQGHPSLPAAPSPGPPSPNQCPPLGDRGLPGGLRLGPLNDTLPPTLAEALPLKDALAPKALAPSAWPPERGDEPGSKRQRFCNTYNILTQSGLLGVTLRVQELLRQNQRSQGQLRRLQVQSGLFVEAVQSGSPDVWARLQVAMLEAGPEAAEEQDDKRVPGRLP